MTGAIQCRSRPGYRPHAFSFLFCFSPPPPTTRSPSSMRAKANALITHPFLKLVLWSEPDMKIRKSILHVCRARYLLTLRHSALIWIGKLRASAGRHLQSIIHYNLPITPTLGIITARALMINSFICRVVPCGLHSLQVRNASWKCTSYISALSKPPLLVQDVLLTQL